MSAVLRAHGAAPISTLVDQLDEPFLYHDPARGGFVSFLRLGGRGWQRTYHLSEFGRAVAEMREVGNDVYIAQNEFFRPNRRVVNCAHLTSLYLDLDTYTVPELAWLSVDSRVHLVEQACEDHGLPVPSLVVHSGRGLQL